MKENTRKIKEIYGCEPIVSSEPLYPLQEWHNLLIEKTVDEITVADVARMLRQNELVDLALSKAIRFLQQDLFAGELFEGELLETLSEKEATILKPVADDLKIIVKNAAEKQLTHEWLYDGEEDEFQKIINAITAKIK